ncbi:MAG: hypothetical protein KDE68_05790 [Rhodocyclaceae bacterium]|nr:hypothetical protein [Rhodocyclaceae bacterium]
MKPLARLALLRGPIAAAIALIALGGAAVWYAYADHARAELAHRLASQNAQRAAQALQRARRDETRLRDTIERYAALADKGLIGPERRLDWVEALDAARQRHGVAQISYEILPQRRLDGDAPAQPLEWVESRMRLRMTVKHAEVVLRVLDDLAALPSAIVQPQRCRLARESSASPALSVDCEIRWLSLRPEAAS